MGAMEEGDKDAATGGTGVRGTLVAMVGAAVVDCLRTLGRRARPGDAWTAVAGAGAQPGSVVARMILGSKTGVVAACWTGGRAHGEG